MVYKLCSFIEKGGLYFKYINSSLVDVVKLRCCKNSSMILLTFPHLDFLEDGKWSTRQTEREPLQSVTTDPNKLWPNGIVPYVTGDSIGKCIERNCDY